jgi:hypothetical protein
VVNGFVEDVGVIANAAGKQFNFTINTVVE